MTARIRQLPPTWNKHLLLLNNQIDCVQQLHLLVKLAFFSIFIFSTLSTSFKITLIVDTCVQNFNVFESTFFLAQMSQKMRPLIILYLDISNR